MARFDSTLSPPLDDGVEQVEIRADDGVSLRADVREPPPGTRAVGMAVLAHAMMARRSEFARPRGGGLARFLAERGWRTVAFDFRGHGDSGRSAAAGFVWGYDDLVHRDLPAVVACARERSGRLPLVVVGHSLGGHTAMLAQGTGAIFVDGIVGFASAVWYRGFEPSGLAWAKKRAVIAGFDAITRARGFFPARALGLGSDDESARYVAAIVRLAREHHWRSDDFRHDYLQALAAVRIPVLAVSSDGDPLQAAPECVERMTAWLGGRREHVRVRAADDGGPAPDHMALVTEPVVPSVWAKAEAFMRSLAVRSGFVARAPLLN